MGVGLIANAGSASQYSMGTLITNGTITEPDTFPDITVDGNVYKYAAKGTENGRSPFPDMQDRAATVIRWDFPEIL